MTRSEIERYRSPLGLRQFVLHRKEKVRRTTAERHRAMQKRGLYKWFIDEIIPLSLFSLKVYPKTYRIGPVFGNQGYDAKILDETGNEIDRIEITVPHDGKAAASESNLAVSRGFWPTHVYNPGDDLAKLIPWITKTCRKKAQKDYSDCTLVVAVDFFPPLKTHKSLYEHMTQKLVVDLRQINFRARRVFLLIIPFKEVRRIYG